MDRITYEEGGSEILDAIAQLWQRLADHHAEISVHFGPHFKTMTWAWRKTDLLEQSAPHKLHVVLAKNTLNNCACG